jgi:hypothetical protein
MPAIRFTSISSAASSHQAMLTASKRPICWALSNSGAGDVDRTVATTLHNYFTNFANTGATRTTARSPSGGGSTRRDAGWSNSLTAAPTLRGLRRLQRDLLFENVKRVEPR